MLAPLFSQQALTLQIIVLDAEKLQTLYFSDLGLTQEQLGQELFEVRMIKNSSDVYEQTRMVFELFKDDKLVTHSVSEQFTIPGDPPATVYSVTNADLFNNNFCFNAQDPNTCVRFNDFEIVDEGEKLQQDILASGKLPVGTYKVLIRLESSGQQIAEQEEILIRAMNPSFVQLIAPGDAYGSGEPPEVYNQYPLFQWNGNGVEYQIAVHEKKEMMESLDDVLNSTPDWQPEPTTALSIQYPQGGEGVVPLEFGKTYYWYVTMFVSTSGGDEKIQSEVWQFKLVDPANVENAHGLEAKNDVLQFLRDLIGDRADEIAKELDGYAVKTILMNGESVSIESLLSKLSSKDYLDKDLEVIDLELR